MRVFVSAIGEDSHRFAEDGRPLVLGGVKIPGEAGLLGNSDADVILHAVTNAVSGLTGKPVLGSRADALCEAGVRDSGAYLERALEDFRAMPGDPELLHLSVSVEALRPKLMPWREEITQELARRLSLPESAVALTATTGEGLTAFGRGEGIRATAILSCCCERSL